MSDLKRNVQDESTSESTAEGNVFSSATPKKVQASVTESQLPGLSTRPGPKIKDDGELKELSKALEYNCERNEGRALIIHVQPDFRYMIYCVSHYVLSSYSLITTSDLAYVTPPTITAFIIMQVTAYIALCDLGSVNTTSAYAREITDDPLILNLIATWKKTPLHPLSIHIINQIRPHIINFHNQVKFTPSLGSSLFAYDAGRLLTPLIFLQAHNCLASRLRDVVNPFIYFANRPIVNYNNVNYHIGQLLGFYAAQQNELYWNWLALFVRQLADPNTFRTYTRRTALAEFNIPGPITHDDANFNPYRYMLLGYEPFIDDINHLICECSKFIKNLPKSGMLLEDYLDVSSGAITRHMILQDEIPTWNCTPYPSTETRRSEFPRSLSLLDFVRRLPNIVHRNTLTRKAQPATGLLPAKVEIHPLSDDDLYSTYSNEDGVFFFDPYEKVAVAHQHTYTSGKVISNHSVDGITLLLPSARENLSMNNSRQLAGAIFIREINPEFLRPSSRTMIPRESWPRYLMRLSASLSNLAKTLVPLDILENANYREVEKWSEPVPENTVLNHVSVSDPTRKYPQRQVFDLWSSYRVTLNLARPDLENTLFFATLELIFGTNTSIIRGPRVEEAITTPI